VRPVRVRIRFFAALRERFGAGGERDVRAGSTVGAVWRTFLAERPELARVPVRFAVNAVYVPASHRLDEGDELAVFPPVSGGV
jgi:MoaE-MoaD fusion protein